MDADLRSIFRRHLPKVHWSSIETGGVEPGVPDLFGCFEGVQFWLELKKTSTFAVAVHESQVAWHTAHDHFKGRSFFAVRRIRMKTRRTHSCDELYLLRGKFALGLRMYGLAGGSPILSYWSGGPARWNWDEVLRHLISS